MRKTEIAELVKSCCFALRHPDPDPRRWSAASSSRGIPRPARSRSATPGEHERLASRAETSAPDPVEWAVQHRGEGIELSPQPGRRPADPRERRRRRCDRRRSPAVMRRPRGPWRRAAVAPARLVAIDRSGEKSALEKKDSRRAARGAPTRSRRASPRRRSSLTYNGQSILSGPKGKIWGHAAFKGGDADEVILEGRRRGPGSRGSSTRRARRTASSSRRRSSSGASFRSGLALAGPRGACRQPRSAAEWPDELSQEQAAVVAVAMKHLEKRNLAGRGPVPREPETRRAARSHEAVPPRAVLRGRRPPRGGRGRDRQGERVVAEVLAGRGRARQDLRADGPRGGGRRPAREAGRGRPVRLRPPGRGREGVDPGGKDRQGEVDRRRGDRARRRLRRARPREHAPRQGDQRAALAGRYACHSQNFCVASDIDQKTCEEAARLLEEGYLGRT